MRYWLGQAGGWLLFTLALFAAFYFSAMLVGIWLRIMFSWLNA